MHVEVKIKVKKTKRKSFKHSADLYIPNKAYY